MSPKFGQLLRASRLGFHWSPAHSCFIRMADGPNGGGIVDLCAPGSLPSTVDGDHRVWWEDAEILASSPALEELRESRRVIDGRERWTLDGEGRRVS